MKTLPHVTLLGFFDIVQTFFIIHVLVTLMIEGQSYYTGHIIFVQVLEVILVLFNDIF